MASENNREVEADGITLMRRAVEAFNAGGATIDAAGDPPSGIYVDEPELVPLRGALEGTVYTGPDSWRDFWDASRESWTELRIEMVRMEQVGSGILAVGTLRGMSRETRAPVEARVAFAAHLRDGLIARNALHLDEAGARAELESD